MSTSTLTNPGSSGLYCSAHLSRRETKRHQFLSGIERTSIQNCGFCSLFLRRQPCITGRQSLRVEAGWLFKGGGSEKRLDASIEHSEIANEEILIFFFQLDLATQVQVWPFSWPYISGKECFNLFGPFLRCHTHVLYTKVYLFFLYSSTLSSP